MVKSNFATAEEWLEARQPKKEPEPTTEEDSGLLEDYMDYQYEYLKFCGVSLTDLLGAFIEFLRKLSPKQLYRDDPSEIVQLWEESEVADGIPYPSFEEFLASRGEMNDRL